RALFGRGDVAVEDRHLADLGHGDVGAGQGLADHVVHRADILADADPGAIDHAAVGRGGDDGRLAIGLAEQADLARAVDLDVRNLAVRGPDAGDVAGQRDQFALADGEEHLTRRAVAAAGLVLRHGRAR